MTPFLEVNPECQKDLQKDVTEDFMKIPHGDNPAGSTNKEKDIDLMISYENEVSLHTITFMTNKTVRKR